ncbi:MAG TPA: MFS transporter [Bryobacteraceae bacterium]|nr:MFS transporter [Bryobacteraceae bacterium]
MTRLRWLVMGVFVFSSALNYLDRQILPALAPAILAEFRLTNEDYGLILGAFSITYAVSAPLTGLFIDRVGLNRGISLAVGLWSLAGVATAFARGFGGLLGFRAALGVAQAGGVPASGKAIAAYLKPEERALGNAVSQIGLGAGAMLAPPLAIWCNTYYGWRTAFFVTGIAGLFWIPVWLWASRLAPRKEFAPVRNAGSRPSQMLRDRRLWAFVAANMLAMTVYSLWTNWVTVFLQREHGLALVDTKWYAAIPPLFFNLGGLAGGWLSLRWMRRGMAAIPARQRACLVSALVLVLTALTPLMPSASLAIAAICLSAFWSSALSVNLYTMPLDVYGSGRAAFAVSMLTSAYGLMQAVFSPAAGKMIDAWGFAPVCAGVALLPLAGWAILRSATRERTA